MSVKYSFKAPTLGSMDILLSLSMTNTSLFMNPALLSASKACPPVIAPSPITATTLLPVPSRSFATAMPRAAEMDVDE